MWRHYLTIALRVLARHRVYAAINIGGLALGFLASRNNSSGNDGPAED